MFKPTLLDDILPGIYAFSVSVDSTFTSTRSLLGIICQDGNAFNAAQTKNRKYKVLVTSGKLLYDTERFSE